MSRGHVPELIFGEHIVCPRCKGKGKKYGRDCGLCRANGYVRYRDLDTGRTDATPDGTDAAHPRVSPLRAPDDDRDAVRGDGLGDVPDLPVSQEGE